MFNRALVSRFNIPELVRQSAQPGNAAGAKGYHAIRLHREGYAPAGKTAAGNPRYVLQVVDCIFNCMILMKFSDAQNLIKLKHALRFPQLNAFSGISSTYLSTDCVDNIEERR